MWWSDCSQNSNHDESWEWSDKALMTWNDDLDVNHLSMQTIMKWSDEIWCIGHE